MIVIAGVALLAAAVAAVAAQRRTWPEPFALADKEGVTGAGVELVVRYADRSSRFRRTGTVVGSAIAAGVWLVHQVATEPTDPSLVLAAVAAVGLTGSLCGAITGEAFRVRRSRPTVRTVSLRSREPSAAGDPATARRERIVVVAGIGAAASSVLAGSVSGGILTTGAFLLLVLRRWAQRRIATRPRPALPVDVAHADTVVRRLAAVHGVGRPATAAAALVLSVAFGQIAAANGAAGAAVPSVALLVAGAAWWWSDGSYGDAHPLSSVATVAGALVATLLAATLVILMVAGRSM